MKFKNSFKICALVFVISLFFSCSKGDSGAADTLIPDLSAQWKNVTNTQDDDDEFFFLVPDAGIGKATSSFDGNERIDKNATSDLHSFSGSYQNSKINFTFNDGPKQGTTYTGKINGNSANATMTLTTPTGTITLQRHQ